MLIARYAGKLTRFPGAALGGHLIVSIRVRRPVRVESHSNFVSAFFRSQHTMASIAELAIKLDALAIKPTATITHAETTSPATWKDALTASGSAPESFQLIKTLVYKPKTAKTATPVPVIVVARDETEVNSGAIGKKLNLKELRLASEDLLTDFFSLDKNSRMSFFSLISMS